MAFTEPWPAPRHLDLSPPLPEDGVRVRLAVAFTGSPLSGIVLSTNSLNPILRFYEDGFETRVIRKVRRRYADIAVAEADATLLSRTPSMLKLSWVQGGLPFLGRPAQSANLRLVLQFLADRGVPLGPKAAALVAGDEAAPSSEKGSAAQRL